MKNLRRIICGLLILTALSTWAQGINYKALIKDGSGNVVASQNITIQFQILQGVGMTNVYQETHSPITNANGIVIVNIGEGVQATGSPNFSTIDWGSDDHYLNVQINTGGGLTDMGTTQFMAVPYALQATKADNGIPPGGTEGQILTVEGGVLVWSSPCTISFYADTDGDGYGDPGDTLKSCQPPSEYVLDNTDCDDTDGTIYPGAQEIVNDGIDNNCDGQIDEASIGQFRDGGVVFWVNPEDNTKGKVCAIENSGIKQWYNGSFILIGGTGLNTGSLNTDLIIAGQGPVEIDYAAGLARAYTGGDYNDWFLPSLNELNEMYNHRAVINATAMANGGTAFANGAHWSSTENTSDEAWQWNFGLGSEFSSGKEKNMNVRAVRAF